MLGVGQTLPDFKIIGVKPGFNSPRGERRLRLRAAHPRTSFEGKWKVIFFYPKDFTFVCPTEIAEFASPGPPSSRTATPSCMGGSTDNEFVKLAWRRDHARPRRSCRSGSSPTTAAH
jgi:alkyl hydroperoxide reductase subunit AhpC